MKIHLTYFFTRIWIDICFSHFNIQEDKAEKHNFKTTLTIDAVSVAHWISHLRGVKQKLSLRICIQRNPEWTA